VKTVLSVLCLALIGLPSRSVAAEEHIHCNLRALSKAERSRDTELVLRLRDALRERKELADGYAYRFEPTVLKDVGEWLQLVAKCCQPLSYEAHSHRSLAARCGSASRATKERRNSLTSNSLTSPRSSKHNQRTLPSGSGVDRPPAAYRDIVKWSAGGRTARTRQPLAPGGRATHLFA
jgi:hypothetical protein